MTEIIMRQPHTLAEVGGRLIQNGYAPLPIKPGTKRPSLGGWTDLKPDMRAVERWIKQGRGEHGVGILGGAVAAVDLDIRDPVLLERVMQWCRDHLGVAGYRVGVPPKTLIPYRCDEPFGKMSTPVFFSPDGLKHQVEILASGSQFVAYAMHPDTGRAYQWFGAQPLDTHADMLPALTLEKAEELKDFVCSIVPKTWEMRGRSSRTSGARRPDTERIFWPVPLIEKAMHLLPNQDLPYDDWVDVMIAARGAAGAEHQEARSAILEWSAKSEKDNPEYSADTFDGLDVKYSDGRTLFKLLQHAGVGAQFEFEAIDVENAISEEVRARIEEVRHENRESRQREEERREQRERIAGGFRPLILRDPAKIPPRQWLYDKHYIAGFVTATVAPGGLGKSSEKIAEALAMVTGQPLLGVVPPRRLRVAYWGGEDPADETERRIAAACIHYGIAAEEIGDRLLVADGDSLPIKLAKQGNDGVKVALPTVESLVSVVQEKGLDVLIIDPFVNTHSVSENDNTAMNVVVDLWRQVARKANCSVELVHHAVKAARHGGNSDELGIAQSRGGGALVDGIRSGRFLVRMTDEDARKLGLLDHRGYYRIEDGKANMTPIEKARWRKLVSVALGNGSGLYPDGDYVAVATAWEPPNAADGLLDDDLIKVKEKIASGVWKADTQASNWAGYAIAEVLDLDPGGRVRQERSQIQEASRARCRHLLDAWLAAGELIKRVRKDSHGREAPHIEVP